MLYFSQLDIAHFQGQITDKISRLIDPGTGEIPEDPVFVSYLELNSLRLMSQHSIKELQRQNDYCRQLLQEAEKDRTGIRLALEQADDLSTLEMEYKALLLRIENICFQEVLNRCTYLENSANVLIGFPPEFQTPMKRILGFFYKNAFSLLDDFLKIVIYRSKSKQPVLTLPQFCEKMFLTQTRIVEENRRKLINKGRVLTSDQVRCPYYRETIIVSSSLFSRKKADDFLALVVALSQLAKVKDSSITTFLTSQSANYLNQANRKLRQYLHNPKYFRFTEEQTQYLEVIGAKEAAKQLQLYEKYMGLWDDKKTLEMNVLSLLIDYKKQDWQYPSIGLFLTGHWNRHHQGIVLDAILAIQAGKPLNLILEQLKISAKVHPKYDAEGSLMRRLAFIHYKAKDDLLKPSFPSPCSQDSFFPSMVNSAY